MSTPPSLDQHIAAAAVGAMPESASPVETESPVSPNAKIADVELANLDGTTTKEESSFDDGEPVVKMKTMRWWHVSILMIAETISLGILSLPKAVASLGFALGMFCIVVFGIVATYTGYVIGQFKLAHPSVRNMADAGFLLFAPFGPRAARIGRMVFGVGSILFLVFIMAAHVLTFSITLNVVTGHGACTIIFMIAGTVACWVCTLPRTLEKVAWISIPSLISVVAAVFIAMIGVASMESTRLVNVQAYNEEIELTACIVGLMDIVMAYAGNVAFFGFMDEMKIPEEYPKALYLLQGFATVLYTVVAAVIYAYAGASVPSPALGATSPQLQKVAYAVAIPTIVIAGVINGQIAIKMVFIIYKKSLYTKKTTKAIVWWVGLCTLLWVAAWALAESIPNFSNLLALVSALFGSWFTYGISGLFWLSLNRGRYGQNLSKLTLTIINVVVVLLGAFLCVVGTWASLKEIIKAGGGAVWACVDNSPKLGA